MERELTGWHPLPPQPKDDGFHLGHYTAHPAETIRESGSALISGVLAEMRDHPFELAKDMGKGILVGAAIGLLPEVALPALAIYAGYELLTHRQEVAKSAQEFGHDIAVIYDPAHYPKGELDKAQKSLNEFGATGAHIIAAGGTAWPIIKAGR